MGWICYCGRQQLAVTKELTKLELSQNETLFYSSSSRPFVDMETRGTFE